MKAVIGLALLILAGILLYEVVSGNAVTIINSIRGTTPAPIDQSGTKTPEQTPQISGTGGVT